MSTSGPGFLIDRQIDQLQEDWSVLRETSENKLKYSIVHCGSQVTSVYGNISTLSGEYEYARGVQGPHTSLFDIS